MTSAAGLLRKLSWRMVGTLEAVVEEVLRGCRDTETVEDGAMLLRVGERVMVWTDLWWLSGGEDGLGRLQLATSLARGCDMLKGTLCIRVILRTGDGGDVVRWKNEEKVDLSNARKGGHPQWI